MPNNANSLLRALAPTPDDPEYDRFSRRWVKFWACTGGALASVALLASATTILDQRHGNGTFFEWVGPFLFAMMIWLFVGQAWLYYTLRLAPWSPQYLRVWWRATGE